MRYGAKLIVFHGAKQKQLAVLFKQILILKAAYVELAEGTRLESNLLWRAAANAKGDQVINLFSNSSTGLLR